MTHYFIVPGLGNSVGNHWQTYFEKSATNFHRIEQKDWDAPKSADWVENISQAISGYDPETVVLIGHSLGCIAIANWAKISNIKIKGALLVAPSDVEAPKYNFNTVGFEKVPLERIDFRTVLVASNNDEWVNIERAELFAKKWGSELINIGEAGHINAASGFGEWNEGLEILKTLE
ncbi:alpha/beta hydrolase [Pedobacter sp. Leaf176]|uniref:RBBP9/YdeN family alpha/beta hydrolase n=1 Tax=Pedobacter sp. Leaf176 TaxID=1736286 RepID=UPI0006F3BE9E|nr:alpha/beta fold hydrolase [Pedobacter sp. Leaf176]KQR71930.1 alpha/beta hydrolase [Pedobacter sp. Leaf176]